MPSVYATNRSRLKEFRSKKFANMRAAKERKRIERLTADVAMPDLSHVVTPKPRPSGFRVTIKCLDDGESVSFVTRRGPFGLTISITSACKKLAAVLKHYRPA